MPPSRAAGRLPNGHVSHHNGGLMQEFLGYWFFYGGPGPA